MLVVFTVAVPDGSLSNPARGGKTLEILKKAGYDISNPLDNRCYAPARVDNVVFYIDRPQNMPKYLKDEYYDLGILGQDVALENSAHSGLEEVLNLNFGKSELVIATKNGVLSFGNEIFRASSEYPLITQKWITDQEEYIRVFGNRKPLIITKFGNFGDNKQVLIYNSSGKTEASKYIGFDLIADTKGTGRTLKENGLKVYDKIMESYACVYKRPGFQSEGLDRFVERLKNVI